MKTPTNPNRKVRNLSRLRERLQSKLPRRPSGKRRHHLPANLTRESQWETGGEPPQVRTSRMFIGMLSLHLVAAIGLVAFHYFGHDPAPKMMTQNPAAPPPQSHPVAPAVPSIPPPVAAVPGPSSKGYTDHIVRIDESWETIAAARGLTVDALRAANPGIECNVGRLLTLPPTPNVISAVPIPTKGPVNPVVTHPTQADRDARRNAIQYTPNPDLQTPATLPAVVGTKASQTQIGGAVKASAAAELVTAQTHVVAKGETIFSIAKRLHVTEKALMKVNSLTDAAKIHPGQKLKVPTPK